MTAAGREAARTAADLPVAVLAKVARAAGPDAPELAEEAYIGAVLSLRKLLNSEDESLVFRAADALTRVWLGRRRHDRKPKSATGGKVVGTRRVPSAAPRHTACAYYFEDPASHGRHVPVVGDRHVGEADPL